MAGHAGNPAPIMKCCLFSYCRLRQTAAPNAGDVWGSIYQPVLCPLPGLLLCCLARSPAGLEADAAAWAVKDT